MTAQTRYRIGTFLLGVAIIGVLFQLLEMLGVIRKYVPTRELSLVVLMLVVLAAALRRGARTEMSRGTRA